MDPFAEPNQSLWFEYMVIDFTQQQNRLGLELAGQGSF
jgi:hypothetical protein